jgi:seryl-tRNA synthetase
MPLAEGLATRGFVLDRAAFQTLESERKTLQTRTQELQASRNSLSKQVGVLKGRGEDAAPVMAQVAALKSELEANEVRLGELLKELDAFLAVLPNLPHDSVPIGKSEADNVELKRWGRRAALTLRSRITSTSAKRSASLISPPPRKSPARASL